MGTNYYLVKNKPSVTSPMHVGKSSLGWRFNFHRISSAWDNPFTNRPILTFPQWKECIEESVGSGDAVLMNEYDEIVEPKEFFELVAEKQKERNKDDFSNCDNIDGYRFTDGWFS